VPQAEREPTPFLSGVSLDPDPFFFVVLHRAYDKLRLVLLYALYKGSLSAEEKHTFIERLGLSDRDKKVIEALGVLGIRPEIPSLVEPKKGKKKETERAYDLSRYAPKLKKILEVDPPSSFGVHA